MLRFTCHLNPVYTLHAQACVKPVVMFSTIMSLKAILALCLLIAASIIPGQAHGNTDSKSQALTRVSVVSHGWHTGLVIPSQAVASAIPEIARRFPDATWLEFGWGDEGFYKAEDITPALVIQAVLWPTDSVMHVVALTRQAEDFFPNSETRSFCLDDDNVEALVRFIVSSFARDQDNRIIKQDSGIYGDSQFYQGVNSYHLFNTCNAWTASGLERAGFDPSHGFSLTADGVLNIVMADARTGMRCPTRPGTQQPESQQRGTQQPGPQQRGTQQ